MSMNQENSREIPPFISNRKSIIVVDELSFYKERLRFLCDKYQIEFPVYVPYANASPMTENKSFSRKSNLSKDENMISTVRKKGRRSRADRSDRS